MRSFPDSFAMSLPSDREILVERTFDAPRELVFDAFVTPAIVRRWLLGPPGWTMPVCEIDARAGGAYRYEWFKETTGERMGMGGTFREVTRASRIVATEKFDVAWYPGEAVTATSFTSRPDGTTHVTLTVTYASKEARDVASRSGMDAGMSAGFARLEDLAGTLATALAAAGIAVPDVTEIASRGVAAIHIVTPPAKMRDVMSPARAELLAAVQAHGLRPAGPWFEHYHRATADTFDFDVCVPVTTPVVSIGRVEPRAISKERVVRTTYTGGYEGLPGAWAAFRRWLEAHEVATRADFFQCYVVGPESTQDPSLWKTELRRPLV